MSMKQYAYPGFGEAHQKSHRFSSAVRTGDFIHCAGQGGFHDSKGNERPDLTDAAQINQAFKNIDTALRYADGAGWSQVYRVNSFHISLDDEAIEIMDRKFKEWMPDNYPTWTVLQVCRLGDPRMRVEIEVSAFDPVGGRREGGVVIGST
ncbi:hypothetical protein N7509_007905 [Penicillium cosmopolitanum]|uniref:Uncharacterized protein n=1 Tax=Penicillium cosmopolitanum TaxID=1131564 RepID=A0A9W9W093_9EURO|nr:uncharacterized protein N7509_007905 [Penicillium cosmopolitanum]KAJ5392415.1 hypothetical protein N7509_007905 [Penicillium cosmopolitanum]